MVAKFVSEFTSKSTNMSKNTRSKTTLNEEKRKDPNVGIFADTSGRVSKTLHLDLSIIYAIFDNDDFSSISHDQSTYSSISKSQLHFIASRPPFMPYTDMIKWELDYTNPQYHSFDDHM